MNQQAQIKFNTIERAENRNGFYSQTGIDLYQWEDNGTIQITGITSKGEAAVGCIKIPKESIQDVINELEKMK